MPSFLISTGSIMILVQCVILHGSTSKKDFVLAAALGSVCIIIGLVASGRRAIKRQKQG